MRDFDITKPYTEADIKVFKKDSLKIRYLFIAGIALCIVAAVFTSMEGVTHSANVLVAVWLAELILGSICLCGLISEIESYSYDYQSVDSRIFYDNLIRLKSNSEPALYISLVGQQNRAISMWEYNRLVDYMDNLDKQESYDKIYK